MKLKEITTQRLIEIIKEDYGISLSKEEAQQFGFSLLHLTKIASVAFARAEEGYSSVQARGRKPLEAKTSK
jgi:hypothetical protein